MHQTSRVEGSLSPLFSLQLFVFMAAIAPAIQLPKLSRLFGKNLVAFLAAICGESGAPTVLQPYMHRSRNASPTPVNAATLRMLSSAQLIAES